MKRILFFFLLLLISAQGNNVLAQTISPDLYKALTIPDSLLKKANSVVRYSFDKLEVRESGKLLKTHHQITAILNEKAEDEAEWSLGYDPKADKIHKVEIVIYDQAGKQVKKYKRGDMYDITASSWVGLTDNRSMHLKHSIPSYPITVEFIYESLEKSYLDLSSWDYQSNEQAIQYAKFEVLVNPALGFRYKNRNSSIKPVKSTVDDLDHYVWEVKNLQAIKPEEHVPAWKTMARVDMAINHFQYDGYEGSFENWKSFGDWISNLNKEVNTLSPERALAIKQMTDSIKSDREKVKFLYQYMQKNTRYVSIQLGIGGFKPFPATFVDTKKYGDCKALSNYMYSLLKAVNIPANYAVIRAAANNEAADPDFPNSPFNHAILCVPLQKDTVWLECTSQTQAFGNLGGFTENRNALLISEGGSKLVNTPKSKMEENMFNTEVDINLSPEGGAIAKIKLNTTGEFRFLYDGMTAIKNDEQKQYLMRTLKFKQPSVFELKHTQDVDGVKQMNMDLEYEQFADIISGDKMFYKPAVFNLWNVTLPIVEKRINDYYFEYPMKNYGKTTLNLPEGYVVETMPTNVSLKFSYGSYEVKFAYDAVKNQVVSEAKFNLTNHVIPAAKYTEMQTYFNDIAKANGKKLILKKKV